MNLAKIFCVTRDEYDLIEDFILYYGHFFGYNNIVILDNNSVHPIVLDVYRKYSDLGVTVINIPSYTGNSQGQAFTKFMHQYSSDCKWLIGLDTDEFMAPMDEEKQSLLDILYNIPENISLCHIFTNYLSQVDTSHIDYIDYKFSRPARSITKFRTIDIPKVFYRSECFVSTANGNHSGTVKNLNFKEMRIPIKYIHFHFVGKKRQIERAKIIIDGYKYTDINKNLFDQLDDLWLYDRSFDGGHRVEEYRNFIIRKILIDLFCKYLKRLPTILELNFHNTDKINKRMFSKDIIYEFENCRETKNITTIEELIICEQEKNRLLYQDAGLDTGFYLDTTYVKDILDNL